MAHIIFRFRFYWLAIAGMLCGSFVFAQNTDSASAKKDSLHYPLKDRRGDRFTYSNRNPFYLSDTGIVKQNIQYDPVTNEYYIIEKIGNTYYRKPTYFSYDEFWKLQNRQAESDYFNQRSQTLSYLNRKAGRPPMQVYNSLFDRIFGLDTSGLKVSIKPQGNVDLRLGYQGQNIKNPTLSERARRNGGFDFDMDANLNVIANIGNKLKLPISYNTLANFDFQNQLKLDYKGKDDELLKSIEAGNISFQTKGTLMTSVQSLFGLKTQLQFGKLFLTAAIASEKSQRQSITLQGGGLSQQIIKKLDDYDENRNFLMGQYFKNHYNRTMANLPVVSSQVQILRVEVWVTNRTGTTTQARTVVGLMDLGESNPYNPNIRSQTTDSLPDNGANDLYASISKNPAYRMPSSVNNLLVTNNRLKPVEDFEKTFARQLLPSEYYFNQQVGFLSLYQQLQPDEVLGIAYQYSFNGRVFQVGEFSQDVAVDSTQGVQKVLFLKLLKATSQRVNLPIWDLMMKNVYSLDVNGLSREDFKLNVFYEEPSGGLKRYLPESSPAVSGRPLLSILNLDRLNNRNDPSPDGQYDYVDSFTVLSQQGKIIFPVLEPFGRDLESTAFFDQSADIKQKYIYYQLYDSIKAIAQTYANLNRYLVQGTVKGSSNTDIYLGGFNIPQGSVTVTAGGQTLLENTDYIVDYNLGTLKIINQAIINSGVPVSVGFENNATYGTQQRSFLGLRADYLFNEKLTVGATMERITERPYFTKTNYGEDPINNAMYGVDFNYRSELPGLTRLLDRLPFYTTTATSNINAYGEAAVLKPGHPAQIGKGGNGLIYIDDFEGSTSNVDLRYPLVSWAMASTPQGTSRFPEAALNNDLAYNKNRARMAWYNIEPVLQDRNSPSNPLRRNLDALSDPQVRTVYTTELFPYKSRGDITGTQTTTFDVAYYPTDPGQYNYETNPSEITAQDKLLNPQKRWGGIMRSIDQTDFVTGNVQFIEFWVQDPFIKKPNSSGGKLFINLGNVSEDILKDGRRFYENGLNTPNQPASIDNSSVWGKTPINPVQVTNAFSNNPADRPYQDVGFDGLDDDSERIVRNAYLQQIAANDGTSSPFYQRAIQDPSNDNYIWYRDSRYDADNTGILGRYKYYNNQQGNSPVSSASSLYSSAATLYPDNEDLNRDNTLNETEEYYEYEIDLKPGMDVGLSKYITDKRVIKTRPLANGTTSIENWFLFRVPITDFTAKIGNIPDFKSIRFIRMYMTGFEDSVVMRFASLDLVRNQWRNFTYELDSVGAYTQLPANSNTSFDVLAVNLEENSSRAPIPYKIPPGIERVQQLSNNGINLLQNEQSMSLRVRNLPNGESRAVFKTLNLDMRQYGRLSMFVHAESLGIDNLQNGQVNAVIRIGQDFLNNYYEIKIPLEITRFGTSDANRIWPDSNSLDFSLSELVNLKLRRNTNHPDLSSIYREQIGDRTFSVLGNPNLGEVRGFLIGIENPKDGNTSSISTEVWVNELRLSELDEHGGYAALGRVDMQLADLGTLSVSANTYTQGWGGLEQRVNERARNNLVQYDAALNIDAGRLLPRKLGITIPVYASINKTIFTPEYDPYDLDIKYKYKLGASRNKDSVRKAALDQTTIKTLNFTNVRFAQPTAKTKLWSLSNFDFSYSLTQITQTTPIIDENKVTKQRGGLGYTYNSQSHFKEPFKRLIRNKSPWFAVARDFNFNLNPSLLSFRADIDRQFGQYVPRIVNTYDSKVERVDTTFDKYFTFDRYYNARWDLTRSLNFDFNATNFARVDEPYGKLNTKAKRDSVSQNFWKGGRNTLYQQRATISYTIPLNKLPFADWITARYNYSTNYNWIGASLLAVNLGNILENGQQNSLNGEFDFTRLYAKSRFLNAVNTPAAPRAPNRTPVDETKAQQTADSSQRTRFEVVKDLKGRPKKEALRNWRRQKREARKAARQANQNEPLQMGGLAQTGGRLLTMVKRASVNYSENYYSRVPGFTDTARILGNNFSRMQPGLDYVFGRQPDSNWLNRKAAQGAITRDSTFNLLYRQTFEQRLSITGQLEPIPEFIIDVNVDKSFNKDFTELFKDTTGSGSNFGHLSPYASGGFSVSYISYQTLFSKHDPTQLSDIFTKFEAYRTTISKRLAGNNKYYDGTTTTDGYATGYGRNSQDVLIPAFIAAYTGKDPNGVALISQNNTSIKKNPFNGIKPLPNWQVTYTGLTKIPALANIFSNISLTHGYNGTLSMNSFNSALGFYDPFHYGTPGFIDQISGNFIPFFLVPNITISEQFSPLIGFDVTTVNQTNVNFQYKRSRQLSLSLVDYQLSEVNSKEIVLGASIRKKNVNLPFKLPGFKKLDPQQTGTGNDLNIRLDFSIRDDAQSNSRIDFPTAYSTGGQKVISLQPSIDYVLNNRINLQLYFDQQRVIPYISTSAPITNTRAGLQIRISLAQ